ncbi:MAG: hypothetical protein LBS27_09755 [Bifidobacteriaceae bacterium]|nr:hypothetical protein [Bifidobacteriaceae bacterium]
MSRARKITTLLATALASVIVLVGTVPCHAEDSAADLSPQAVAAQIEGVAPLEIVEVPVIVGDSAVAVVDGGTVTVPEDAAEPLQLEASDATASDLTVSLPELRAAEPSVLTDDGTIVYGSDEDVSLAVQVVDDGVRIQTVSNSADAPTEFSYEFGETVRPVIQPDGSAELIEESRAGGAAIVGAVAVPWAVDANGERVATEFRAEGNELVQVIEVLPTTEFPVVADPKVTTTWWNTTVYFNKAETRVFVAGTGAGSWLSKYFGLPGRVISGVLGGYAAAAAIYLAAGKCLKLVQYMGSIPVPQPYSGNEAGGYCS